MAQIHGIKKIASFKKSLLKDDPKPPRNFDYFKPTFVCLYFIIKLIAALFQILQFNKLLHFFGIKNTGNSYFNDRNAMVECIYRAVSEDEIAKINKSPRYSMQFDGSTSKRNATSYLSLVLSYFDMQKRVPVTKFIDVCIYMCLVFRVFCCACMTCFCVYVCISLCL